MGREGADLVMTQFIYHQKNGALYLQEADGNIYLGTGYSGHGDGLNDPADEAIRNVGTIPRGLYEIGAPFTHPAAGPVTMRLTPIEGTDTHGRDGFLIHGDTASRDHTASHGCVIMDRPIRQLVAAAAPARLEVV